jgi:hypothetical protein
MGVCVLRAMLWVGWWASLYPIWLKVLFAGILTEINLFKSFFSTLFMHMLNTGDSERRDDAFEMSMYAASAVHFYALFANL